MRTSSSKRPHGVFSFSSSVFNATTGQPTFPLTTRSKWEHIDPDRLLLNAVRKIETPCDCCTTTMIHDMLNLPITKGNISILVVASMIGYEHGVRMFLKHGANIEMAAITGDTPLLAALKFRSFAVIPILLAHGADIHVRDQRGETALHTMASENMCELVEVFVERGADVNAQNNTGCTPLHVAAYCEKIDMIRTLLRRGARTDIVESTNCTPLDLALRRTNHRVIVELILRPLFISSI